MYLSSSRVTILALSAVLCLLSSTHTFGSLVSSNADALVGDDGCFPEDPECGGGFWGIAQLNEVLSNWNQQVPPANPNADWSGDGYIGIDDLNYVLSRWNAGTPPDGDLPCIGLGCGYIGIADLNIVLANWNMTSPPADPLADNSGDGYIGIDDLSEILANWNAGTPPIANTVPEPTAVALMGLIGLYALRRR